MQVLLADDQAKVRSAIRLLLEQDERCEVVGEAVDATGLVDWLNVLCPDLVLLDWELPGAGGEQILSQIQGNCSRARVIAMSGLPDARQAALEAGADGFVSKGDPPERLLEAIDHCADGSERSETSRTSEIERDQAPPIELAPSVPEPEAEREAMG
jgi:DNA-binding NarL/FixJ family response regulator